MNKNSPIKILIADDHPLVREGLSALLGRRDDMQVVGEAENGEEAVSLFRLCHPDVTLMDLRMPKQSGVAAITAIREEFPGARIVALTTYDGDEDIYRALRAGARGYLLKDMSREELVVAIRTVHSGQTCIPPEVASKLTERMGRPELTTRELEVLQLMAAGHTNHEIGDHLYITEGTVKAHVNSILGKMNVNDRTQAVTRAIKRGLVQL